MPPMRCNRASLMQTKLQQFSTMEASLTLNIGAQIFICTPAPSDFTVKHGNHIKTNVSVRGPCLFNEPEFGVYVMKVRGLRKPKSTIRLCLRATCPRRSASASWTSSLCSSSVSRWRINIFPLLAYRIGSARRHPDVFFWEWIKFWFLLPMCHWGQDPNMHVCLLRISIIACMCTKEKLIIAWSLWVAHYYSQMQ